MLKTHSILFALLLFAGCTSMAPIDDGTRAFLEGKPGAVSDYKTTVETKSGKQFTFEAGTARFDTSNGKNVLILPNDFSFDRELDDTEKIKSIPSSEIRTMSMDYDIIVHSSYSRGGRVWVAHAGKWKFLKNTDTGFVWSSNYASINSKDIINMQLSYVDSFETVMCVLGIIACIGWAAVAILEVSIDSYK